MPCGAPWGVPDSPQAEVGDSCSALGTCRGPSCVPTVCSNTWEGLEPGASPGLIWAILERKVAGTLGTVLCCWEKTEEGYLGDQPPPTHTKLHQDVQLLPPSAGAATVPQKRGPASRMSLTSALVVL